MGISKSVSTVTIINIASAALSVVNVAVIAYFFGTSSDIEIYFAATLLLNTLAVVANNGQLFDILLPIYHRVSAAQNKSQGLKVFATVVNWLLLSSMLIISCIYLNLPTIVDYLVPGFDPDMKLQVVSMAQWVLPLMLLMLLCSFITTYLNAESNFGKVEFVSFVCRSASLLCVVFSAAYIGVWALVVALWLELSIRFVCLITMAKRIGYSHSLVFKSEHLDLRDIIKQIALAYAFVITGQLYIVVLNAGVSQLPQGFFAIFNYVKRLYERTNRIFLRPVSLVFFTGASQIFSGKEGDVRALMNQALGLFMFVAVPVMLYMFFFGELCLEVLLGTRQIAEGEIRAGAILLSTFYSAMLVGGVVNLYRRLLIAGDFAKHFYVAACFCQCAAAAAVWLLLPDYGISGVVYVWMFNAVLTLVVFMVLVKQCIGFYIVYPLEKLRKWIATGLLVSLVTFFYLGFIQNHYLAGTMGSRLENTVALGVNSVLFFLLVAVVGLLFNISEVKQLLFQVRKYALNVYRSVV